MLLFAHQVSRRPARGRKRLHLQPICRHDTPGGRLRLLGGVLRGRRHRLLPLQHAGSAGVFRLHARLQGLGLRTHFCEYGCCCSGVEPAAFVASDPNWFPGLCDHSEPGLPLAGVLLRLGQGPAEHEGRHRQRGHLLHARPVHGEQRHLRGHGVRQPENPQLLRGEKRDREWADRDF